MNIVQNKVMNLEKDIDIFLANRNILYNIAPIGIGTPYVESLSSYIIRLAEFHNMSVSSLIEGVIAPYLTIDYIKQKILEKSTSNYTSTFINSNGLGTLDYINALEILTGRNDIQYLTLVNWKGVFRERVISHKRKWCPKCLEQMRYNDGKIYEPLLWIISSVDKCDIHNIPLRDKCHKCNRELSFFHKKISNGYCQHCKEWLGQTLEIVEKDLDEEEIFILENFKEVIQFSPSCVSFPSSCSVSIFLTNTLKELEIKNISEVSRFFNVNYQALLKWINNIRYPNSVNLLKIVRKTNITIYQIKDSPKIGILNLQNCKKKMKKELTNNEIEHILRAELGLKNPRSLHRIIKEEDFGYKRVRKYFPELCKSIREHYLECRKNGILEYKETIRFKIMECLDKDVHISLNQFAQENGYRTGTIKQYQPELCSKLIQRHKDYLNYLKEKRNESIFIEVEKAIQTLKNEGIYPSKHAIVKMLGNNHLFFRKIVKNRWKDYMRELGYEIE